MVGTSDRSLRLPPQIGAGASGGRVVVAWEGSDRGARHHELRWRVLDDGGLPQTPEVTAAIEKPHGPIVVAPLPGEDFVILVTLGRRPRDGLDGSFAAAITIRRDGTEVGRSLSDRLSHNFGDGHPPLPAEGGFTIGATLSAPPGPAFLTVSRRGDGPAGFSLEPILDARPRSDHELDLIDLAAGGRLILWREGGRLVVRSPSGAIQSFELDPIDGLLEPPRQPRARRFHVDATGSVWITRDTRLERGQVRAQKLDMASGRRTEEVADASWFPAPKMPWFRIIRMNKPGLGIELLRDGAKPAPVTPLKVDSYGAAVTWTGDHFVVAYAVIRANTWAIFAQTMNCESVP